MGDTQDAQQSRVVKTSDAAEFLLEEEPSVVLSGQVGPQDPERERLPAVGRSMPVSNGVPAEALTNFEGGSFLLHRPHIYHPTATGADSGCALR